MSGICEVCGLPKELCVCEDIAREQQKITIAMDKRRYGKMMTIVYGVDSHDLDIQALITKLKSKCACHRTKVKETLEEMGFTVEVM
jgi:translation initiation factor 1